MPEIIHYAMPGSLNFSDYDDTERELPRVQTTVGFEGDVWMPVRTSLGLMFIDPAYLKHGHRAGA